MDQPSGPPNPPPTLSRTFFSFLFFSILAELRLASICARLFTASLTILVGLFLVAIRHHQPRPNRTHFDGAGPSWVLQHFGLHTVVVHDTSRITAEMQFTLHRARDSDVSRSGRRFCRWERVIAMPTFCANSLSAPAPYPCLCVCPQGRPIDQDS